MMDLLSEYATLIVAVLAALAALAAFGRRSLRSGRRWFAKFNAATDTLIGREAITHPDTGEVLVEATPGLGARLATMEAAIHGMSQNTAAINLLAEKVTSLESAVTKEHADLWSAIRGTEQASPTVTVIANPATPAI